MKITVCLVAGVAIGYLLLRLLSQTIGWASAWPIFAVVAAALATVSFLLERRPKG